MLAILKIIHFLCLFGGGAAGIANGMLMRRVMKADGPPPEMVPPVMKTLGKIGFASIILLWVTGLLMAGIGHGFGNLSALFWIKLIGATMTLGAVSMMTVLAAKAEGAGTPPPLARMKPLSHVASIGAFLAVIFAVLAFL